MVNRNKRRIALDLKDAARARGVLRARARAPTRSSRASAPASSSALGVDYACRRRDPSADRLRVDLRLRADRAARAPRRPRHQLPGLRRRARPDRARATARRRCATCRSRTCSAARRRPRSRSSPRSSARSAPAAGGYVDVAMADGVARAQHLPAARARAMGARAAARRGPADRRRAVLRRLSDAGRPLARRRRARGQVLEGAVRDARAPGPRRRAVRAGRRRRARARRARGASSPAAPLAAWTERFAERRLLRDAGRHARRGARRPAVRRARAWSSRRTDGSREYAPPFKLSGHDFAVRAMHLPRASTAPRSCAKRATTIAAIDALAARAACVRAS